MLEELVKEINAFDITWTAGDLKIQHDGCWTSSHAWLQTQRDPDGANACICKLINRKMQTFVFSYG